MTTYSPEALRALLARHNLTPYAAAKRAGFSPNHLQKCVRGLRTMSPRSWDLLQIKLASADER